MGSIFVRLHNLDFLHSSVGCRVMEMEIGLVTTIISGVAAVVSAVTALLTVRSVKRAQQMLETKDRSLSAGPDVEDVSTGSDTPPEADD